MNARVRWMASLFVMALASIASAVPARPLYEPEPRAKPSQAPNLVGTAWAGKLYSEGERIWFYPDGFLIYGGPGNRSAGSWKLDGNQLYFEINKYSEFKTTVRGDLIDGFGWNKAGQETKPFLRLQGLAPALDLPPAKANVINRR